MTLKATPTPTFLVVWYLVLGTPAATRLVPGET
jgi:hypothetical protein